MLEMLRAIVAGGAAAALIALAMPGPSTAADGVEAIKQRGTLIVGVKAD